MAFSQRDHNGRFVKGHTCSDEVREKIRNSLTGYKHSPEAVENMRKSNLGNKSTLGKRGKNANNWQGGKVSEYRRLRNRVEWKEWRVAVYDRDDWTCQRCLERGVHLHPHHILNQHCNHDLVFSVENGITLCKDCHYCFHKTYGFRKNTAVQLQEFLKGG